MKKFLSVQSVLALLVVATACTKSTPSRPSDVQTSVQAASGSPGTPVQPAAPTDVKTAGITLTTPQLVTPADGQRFQFVVQPITLVIKNAVATGSTPLTYTFQVATDAGFANVVYSKEGVAEGSGGQTSVTIDKRAGATDYFWRARAVSGDLPGPFTSARSFNVGPEVVLQAPVLAQPAQSGNANATPTLATNNAARTGPAGQLLYRFELSDSQSFGNLVFVATGVPEGPGGPGGQTSTQVNVQLTSNNTYFWHVQASDPSNNITGPFSAVFSFKVIAFDWSQVIMVNSPADFGSWPETAKITNIDFTPNAFLVDFDRRTGPNRWLDVGFGSGNLEYTLGMCVNPNPNTLVWFCSAVVQFWYGRDLGDSAPPRDVGREWFYDPARWGPILGYQPRDGESVAIFVGAGNLRDGANITRANCPRQCERSNAAVVPWQNGGFASYVFSIGNRVISKGRR